MLKRKYLYGALILVLCFFAVELAVNIIVPQVLNKNPNRIYDIAFKKISFSLLKNRIAIKNAAIIPIKDSITESSMEGNIPLIEIKNFSLYNLLVHKKLKSKGVTIHRPDFKIISRKKKQAAADNSKSIGLFWKDFYDRIELKSVAVKNGTLEIVKNVDTTQSFLSKNINIEIQGVYIDSTQLSNPLPFIYSSYTLDIGNTFSSIGKWYKVSMQGFKATEKELIVKKVKVTPKYTRKQFVSKLKKEADYIVCEMDSMKMYTTKWGFYKDSLKINGNSLKIDGMRTTLYRDKLVRDDRSKKKLYSAVLRDLPFYITLDTLTVTNSELTYEEKTKVQNGPGILQLKELRMTASNIDNFNIRTLKKDTKIALYSKLYGQGKLEMHCNFNIANTKDTYNLHGNLSNMNVSLVSAFTRPTMNTNVTGYMHELDFIINGSDYDASAVLNFDYENLKVEILHNKTGKTRAIQTAIANILLKKNTKKGKVSNEKVYVKRDPSKSIFNQIWKCIETGLKKTLL